MFITCPKKKKKVFSIENMSSIPSLEVLRHVVDVHCHPTDSPVTPDAMRYLPITICAMSSQLDDQSRVRDLALAYPEKVVPCFG